LGEKNMTDVKTAETEVLDAERTALVVIDLQNGIANLGRSEFG
jgi:nicotinate-nucleotide pyrophosphorylase